MSRWRDRYGASVTTLSLTWRLVLSVVVLLLPLNFLLSFLAEGGERRAFAFFLLAATSLGAAWLLRHLWVVSDDARRDDYEAQRLETRLAQTTSSDEERPSIADRPTPPRRW